jgi:two-component system NtrC family sensor kinase
MSPIKKVSGLNGSVQVRPTVLFVDDSEELLASLRRLFAREPIRILTAVSGLHALQVLMTESVHLVVSDYAMPGMNGNALLHEVGRLYPLVGRILLTGVADSELVLDTPCRVLTKGMDPGLVRHAIVRAALRHV